MLTSMTLSENWKFYSARFLCARVYIYFYMQMNRFFPIIIICFESQTKTLLKIQ